MSWELRELYAALREAGVGETKARAAVIALASRSPRLAARLRHLIVWVAVNLVLTAWVGFALD